MSKALALAALIAGGGCATLEDLSFSATPPDPASRVAPAAGAYPSVRSGCRCEAPSQPTGRFQRVLIIVLENQDYERAMADPYLGGLARQGASFTNFHGLFHPSYSNYLAIVAGKEIRTLFDRQKDLEECTIGDLLKSKGLAWKNYAEGYPGSAGRCFTGSRAGRYERKHVPFMSFAPIQEHSCASIVDAAELGADIATGRLPAYMFYSPDVDHDGHASGLAGASRWLRDFLEPLRADARFMDGTLIVVTFDESSRRSAHNHIYTVFLGPMVRPGNIDGNANHYNVLRTIEDNFGLCPLGEGDAGARPITEAWKQ